MRSKLDILAIALYLMIIYDCQRIFPSSQRIILLLTPGKWWLSSNLLSGPEDPFS
jgi:hypothetical protein